MSTSTSPSPEIKINTSRWFYLACLIHIVCWTLAPTWIRGNVPFDTVEGIAWGNQWQWGYDKHPPLAAWLSALFTKLGNGVVGWPVYLLSQLSVAICFWAVWRLANKMLSPLQALLSIFLLEGIYFYNIASEQFNPNILMLPLWALTFLACYVAIKQQKFHNWLLASVCAGLSMLAKYESALLLACVGLIILFTPEGRVSFKRKNFYVAIALFLCILLPNFLWLIKNNFAPFTYTVDRLDSQTITYYPQIFDRIYFPLRFLFEQLLTVSPLLLLAIPFLYCERAVTRINKFDRNFIAIAGLGPLVLTLLISAGFGLWLHSLWAFPYYSLLGISVIMWRRPKITAKIWRIFIVLLSCFFILLLTNRYAFLVYGPYLRGEVNAAHFPGKIIADTLTKEWQQHYHQRLAYVAGDHIIVEHVAAYSPDQPQPYFDWSTEHSVWIDENKMKQTGAIFVWYTDPAHPQLPDEIAKRFPTAISQAVHSFQQLTGSKLVKPVTIGVALLPPEPPRK